MRTTVVIVDQVALPFTSNVPLYHSKLVFSFVLLYPQCDEQAGVRQQMVLYLSTLVRARVPSLIDQNIGMSARI
jgi:hypothetical protein